MCKQRRFRSQPFFIEFFPKMRSSPVRNTLSAQISALAINFGRLSLYQKVIQTYFCLFIFWLMKFKKIPAEKANKCPAARAVKQYHRPPILLLISRWTGSNKLKITPAYYIWWLEQKTPRYTNIGTNDWRQPKMFFVSRIIIIIFYTFKW